MAGGSEKNAGREIGCEGGKLRAKNRGVLENLG